MNNFLRCGSRLQTTGSVPVRLRSTNFPARLPKDFSRRCSWKSTGQKWTVGVNVCREDETNLTGRRQKLFRGPGTAVSGEDRPIFTSSKLEQKLRSREVCGPVSELEKSDPFKVFQVGCSCSDRSQWPSFGRSGHRSKRLFQAAFEVESISCSPIRFFRMRKLWKRFAVARHIMPGLFMSKTFIALRGNGKLLVGRSNRCERSVNGIRGSGRLWASKGFATKKSR